MRNWKTTLAGLLVAIATAGPMLGVPSVVTDPAAKMAAAFGLMAARDHDNHATDQR